MSLGQILANTLDKIYNVSNTRKLLQLRQDAKDVMDSLESLLEKAKELSPGEVVVAADVALQSTDTSQQESPEEPSNEQEIKAPEMTSEIEECDKDDIDPVVSVHTVKSQNLDSRDSAQTIKSQNFDSRDSAKVIVTEAVANVVFPIFQSAINTKRGALVEAVIDCFQILIAHRLIQGVVTNIGTSLKSTSMTSPSKSTEESKESVRVPYQAQVVDMICSCEDIQEEGVELKVLKALLTAVTSSTFCVHGHGLLLAVRTSYNIYLMSRTPVNQTTAKATLTQMLNVVFQRLEMDSQQITLSPIVVTDYISTNQSSAMIDITSVQNFLNKVIADTLFAPSPEDVRQSVAGAFDRHEGNEGSGLISSSDSEDHEHIEWRGQQPVAAHSVQSAEQQPVAPIVETVSSSSKSVTGMKDAVGDLRGSVLQRDAYLVFRALCKLSASETNLMDNTAIRGKVLALELIKILLENSGPVFRNSEKFIAALKDYLCLSLLKNCSSSIQEALSLTCSIFLTLLAKFRQVLKAEIAVFFPMVILKPIEPSLGNNSVNSGTPVATIPASNTYTHQLRVLRLLQPCCMDGQFIIDLFVNYDCDLDNSNLFERLLMSLVRKAQGSSSTLDSEKAQQQEAIIREESLKCIIKMLNALIEWYSVHTINPQSKKANSDEGVETEGLSKSRQELSSLTSSPNKSSNPTLTGLVDKEGDDPTSQGDQSSGTRSSELLEIRDYKLRFQKGLDLFNKKPKKGVEYMISEKLIGQEAEDIALFLLKTENLDKTKIGHYLGDRDPVCIQVMHAYVDLMDFSDQELDVALRNFLLGFRLPGEAPQIDRLMEKFAERYLVCNPSAFKSADVAYVLSYSMIMLNTDAHNQSVKNKMTKEDFLKNNKGINDGSDLPAEYLSAIYDRILSNEIKMRDDSLLEGNGSNQGVNPAQNKAGVALLDMFLSLIPGRKQNVTNEPSEAAIKRTQDYLREKAKGATFFEASNADTVWPLFEVAWAPLLGAFSVLFERHDEQHVVGLCLEGFVASICITAQLGMSMLRNTFITSLSRFTMFYNPSHMKVKNALAFKALLLATERVGDFFGENWVDVLRCVSQWEQVHQVHVGGPTDATLFAIRDEPVEPIGTAERFRLKLRQFSRLGAESAPSSPRTTTSITDQVPEQTLTRMSSKKDDPSIAPPPQVLLAVDIQDINRLFIESELLDSKAIVEFVTALCKVSDEELKLTSAPRVFSLTKIVEISHFNMGRIRLVWSRIWAILADFFIQVGCQSNLQLSMYAVDSLRQLSMKFLERDELTNYTFQNDFLKPFVVVMRQSKAREIRELIIRCVSQMVLARVSNIKSGWKSMFMVFTTAAGDEDPQIVRLAFDTIEKIVREHFNFITETETTTFTDYVALNSIAFIRYCAIKLAEGSIGDVEELPENLSLPVTSPTRIVPAGSQSTPLPSRSVSIKLERSKSVGGGPRGIRFIDKDEHVYFWFPLLAGLSELTFDPRQEIRTSALDVLFDTLKYHGSAFSESLWARILDSVLLPIFDHVRAEVTDTTTFTDDNLRAQIDAWLYETCVKCLQHLVDLFLQFHSILHPLLDRLFQLLVGFMQRSHQSLASMGIAALVRFLNQAGEEMTNETWTDALEVLVSTSERTKPSVADLVTPPERILRQAAATGVQESTGLSPNWTLRHGVGSRRLSEVRCRAAVQLLTVQAIGEIYKTHHTVLDTPLLQKLIVSLETISLHSRKVDTDIQIRQFLAVLQSEDHIGEDQRLMDPPLVRLEIDSTHSLLSLLLHICLSDQERIKEECEAERKLMELCLAILERFDVDIVNNEGGGVGSDPQSQSISPTTGRVVAMTSEGDPVIMASISAEYNMYSTLIVATLKALVVLPETMFRRHIKALFPLLTNLIACEYIPLEVQLALSEVFSVRIGPLLS
eukprot:g1715.t1